MPLATTPWLRAASQGVGFCLVLAGSGLVAGALVVMIGASRPPPENPANCQSCGYDLSAYTPRRCPECGLRTGSHAHRRSDRALRLGLKKTDRMLTLGAAMLSAGLLVLAIA